MTIEEKINIILKKNNSWESRLVKIIIFKKKPTIGGNPAIANDIKNKTNLSAKVFPFKRIENFFTVFNLNDTSTMQINIILYKNKILSQ